MLFELALKEQQKLKKKITRLQNQIQRLPDGKLIYSRNGKYTRWYCSDGHNSVHIPKKERDFAEKLAYKRFLELQLSHLEHEYNAINFYLRHHDTSAEISELEFLNSPMFHDLISPYFTPLSQELSEWAQASYEKNPNYPQKLIHKTFSGNLVRSKSEAMIDMVLFNNLIPFRYECKLTLGDIILYPDFTIRHPVTGEIFYWEHFGLLDDPIYVQRMLNKLQLYISNGIIPSVNLIVTFETREHPLTLSTIQNTVEHFFLQ